MTAEVNEFCKAKSFSKTAKPFTTPDVKEIPLERVFQKKIKDYLSTIPGCCVWKVNQGAYSSSGIPDIHCVINGKFFAFEVKRPWIGKETKLQREMVEKINNAGGRAEFVSFVYEVKEVLESEGVVC